MPVPTPVKVVEPPAPVPVPAPPPVPKTVWLDVNSTPVGAQVKRGDEVLGITPLHVELPQGEATSLSVVLTNHLEETREVALSENVALSVDLKPVPKPKKKKRK